MSKASPYIFVAVVLGAASLSVALPVSGPGAEPAGAAGTVTASVSDASVVEGNTGKQIVNIPVTLSAAASGVVTVGYRVEGLSATDGVDFTPRTGTLTFNVPQVAKNIPVPIIGDTGLEPNETAQVTLTSMTGADPGDTTGALTIIDDDTAPLVGASVGDLVMHEGDAGVRSVQLRVTLSSALATDAHITVALGGTASPGADDMYVPKTIVVARGLRTAAIALKVVGDVAREGEEMQTVHLSSSDVAIGRADGALTILDEASDAGVTVAGPTGNVFLLPPGMKTGSPGEVIWAVDISTSPASKDYLFLYWSTGQRGKHLPISGRMSIPTAPAPPGGRDVVVWGEGTTGSADACAPSMLVYPVPMQNQLVAAGYAVVAPDYEGLGTAGPHAYVESDSEARTLLDAVRAVRDMDTSASNRAVLFGGSRGGHAVLAANERAASYAPELDLKGVIGLGAGVIGSDDSFIDYAMQSFDRAFLMMAGRAAQKIYGAKATPLLNYYFTPLGISQLPLAEKDCTTPYLAWLNANPSTLFHLSPRPPMTAEQQALRDLISVGTRAASSPIILMMGTNDTIVPPSLIPAWVDEACSHGQQVEVRWFPTGHFPIPTTDIASWISDRFAGVPAGSSCP